MELILVQHGSSAPKTEDPERPLTETGREETARVAAWLAVSGVSPSHVRHSGKRRAAETAAIMALVLKPAGGVDGMSGLNPNDDVALLAEALNRRQEDIMLVGHLPNLARLASLLLAGDPDLDVVRFRNSGAVCIGREDNGWSLRWAITPESVPQR